MVLMLKIEHFFHIIKSGKLCFKSLYLYVKFEYIIEYGRFKFI